MSITGAGSTRTVATTRSSAAPTSTLRQGSRGTQVRTLQQALGSLGFNPGGADGDFGPRTGEALRAFQRSAGITADGIYGPQTRAALGRALDNGAAPAATPPAPTTAHAAPHADLRQGSRGSAVRDLQSALGQVGHNAGPNDGVFGGRTRAALQDFQTQWGLRSDGIYGPQTRAALDRALGGAQPPPRRTQPGNVGNVGAVAPGQAGSSALDIARSQIGVREATGNNDGVPSERYAGGRREPWCADFVSWSFRQAGRPLPGNQRSLAGVQYMEDQMKHAGAWFPRGSRQPQPGDVIFFANRGGSDGGTGRHVGIVERVENGRVYTVEGNASNSVKRNSYPLDLARISGYGRW